MLPKMLDLVKKYGKNVEEDTWDYFYDLMFTKKNLKLVHPVCQAQLKHETKIDESKVFLKD